MQTLFSEPKRRNVLGDGLGMVMRNKRYIVWFWLLNLVLAWFGTSSFRQSAHAVLDHSLYSEKLVHGFDLAVMIDLYVRPEFGFMAASTTPAVLLALVFFLLTALLIPGVFAGYASTYRLPREDFFRACGRNLWRFIRLMIIAGIIMGIIAGLLFAANGAIVAKAGESANEVLPFTLRMINLFLIFLVMTALRIWFDLAEADVVLNDQRAVRKSLAFAFRHAFGSLPRLLGSYLAAALVAAILLVGGLWCWMRFVPATGIGRAFLLSQLIVLLLLIPRFWQRGVAVSYWQQMMLAPVVAVEPVAPPPVPIFPEPAPVGPVPVTPASGI